MKDIKIAVQVRKVKDPAGKEALKATMPIRLIFENDFDAKGLKEELNKFEDKYLKLVDILTSILKLIKSRERKGKVLLYWILGDEIHHFTEENKAGALFLENLTAHLVRDTGVSEKMLNRCKKFRVRYPEIFHVDLARSFDSYVATFEGGYVSARRKRQNSE